MDIVERLRTKKEKYIATVDWGIGVYEELADSDTPDADCIEAADEIEQLREALAFYAEWGIDAPAVDAIIEEDCGDKARAALNIVLGEEE